MNKHINTKKIARAQARTPDPRKIDHYRRIREYMAHVSKLAVEHSPEFARAYTMRNPYRSRGKGQATMFSSQAALSRRKGWSRIIPGGKVGSRECLRRIRQMERAT